MSFTNLQQLNQNDLSTYLVAAQYINDLNAIANGRAQISWSIGLDGAFTPNTQSDPDSTLSSSSVVFPVSDGSPTVVLQANHNDGTMNCGFIYQVIPNNPTATQLQNQVELQAYMKFNNDEYPGEAVPGTVSDKTSDTHWERYLYDHVDVWFGP